jgi:hypothetical protein
MDMDLFPFQGLRRQAKVSFYAVKYLASIFCKYKTAIQKRTGIAVGAVKKSILRSQKK